MIHRNKKTNEYVNRPDILLDVSGKSRELKIVSLAHIISIESGYGDLDYRVFLDDDESVDIDKAGYKVLKKFIYNDQQKKK